MIDYETYKGVLNSEEYFEVLSLLRENGITYSDIGFGFDRYYFNRGLYRLDPAGVHLIFVMDFVRPFKCRYLSCTDCRPEFRLTL
jgi:hypothetical protein